MKKISRVNVFINRSPLARKILKPFLKKAYGLVTPSGCRLELGWVEKEYYIFKSRFANEHYLCPFVDVVLDVYCYFDNMHEASLQLDYLQSIQQPIRDL